MKDVSAKIRCEACPIRCWIADGQTGACDRYGNVGGELTRLDPVTVLTRAQEQGAELVPFALGADGWAGELLRGRDEFLTAVGAGTTYPDYKPAPFIVSSQVAGVDTVTVVTEGIFSYCGVKVKIDTDRHVGDERSPVRFQGQPVGHVTTTEYGSQMLSLGGVHHLTSGDRNEGVATMELLVAMCGSQPVELQVEGGAHLQLTAGEPPVIDGELEERMRVGCGSATIGMFARSWHDLVDEVVVVDEHITGVLSEHQAGAVLGMTPSGIRMRGRRSTPGRYFGIAAPGSGWGGTDLQDPIDIVTGFDPRKAWPGLRLLMVSTTGEDAAYYVLDDECRPVLTELPPDVVPSVTQIGDNCEPALTSVLFVAGAGGSLRAGVTTSPIALTRSVREAMTRVTVGGAPTYVWPGGGIMVMVDVSRVPPGSFGYVPTPAIVAPLEFTLPRDEYVALGGHEAAIQAVETVLAREDLRRLTVAGPDDAA
jgi:6-hydroxynicotinate reductase